MTSLIKQFKRNNLNYSAFSLSESSSTNNKYAVFTDDDSYFLSKEDVDDQWWQVSFEAPVFVKCYILKTKRQFTYRHKSWIVNVSFDNLTWETVDTKNDIEIYNNEEPNLIENGAYCMHFRIIRTENRNNAKLLIFTFFDAFGEILCLVKGKNRTCKRRMCSTIHGFRFVLVFVIERKR